MNIRYGKDLEPGDLIGVAYNNYIHHAIFAGVGRVNNPQFYFIHSVLSRKQQNMPVWKSYITRNLTQSVGRYGYPIVKIHEQDLTDSKDLADYLEARDYLKQLGKI